MPLWLGEGCMRPGEVKGKVGHTSGLAWKKKIDIGSWLAIVCFGLTLSITYYVCVDFLPSRQREMAGYSNHIHQRPLPSSSTSCAQHQHQNMTRKISSQNKSQTPCSEKKCCLVVVQHFAANGHTQGFWVVWIVVVFVYGGRVVLGGTEEVVMCEVVFRCAVTVVVVVTGVSMQEHTVPRISLASYKTLDHRAGLPRFRLAGEGRGMGLRLILAPAVTVTVTVGRG